MVAREAASGRESAWEDFWATRNSPKAELTIAATLDDRDNLVQQSRRCLRRLYGILAIWMRAPLETRIVIHIGSIQEFPVSACESELAESMLNLGEPTCS